jgi:hypothetical protein
MSAGWFALAGVVIGGTLNGVVSWALSRHGEWVTGRVAALLVIEELTLSVNPVAWAVHSRDWDFLRRASAFARRTDWDQNRATIGRVLSPHGFTTIASAHRQLTALEPFRDQSRPLMTDAEYVQLRTIEMVSLRAMAHLRTLIYRPPIWTLRARRRFDREHQAEIDGLIDQDRALHGGVPPDESGAPHSD